MWSIFSCTRWPSEFLFWRTVCSDPLPIFFCGICNTYFFYILKHFIMKSFHNIPEDNSKTNPQAHTFNKYLHFAHLTSSIPFNQNFSSWSIFFLKVHLSYLLTKSLLSTIKFCIGVSMHNH